MDEETMELVRMHGEAVDIISQHLQSVTDTRLGRYSAEREAEKLIHRLRVSGIHLSRNERVQSVESEK
jgi:hypothetical protein